MSEQGVDDESAPELAIGGHAEVHVATELESGLLEQGVDDAPAPEPVLGRCADVAAEVDEREHEVSTEPVALPVADVLEFQFPDVTGRGLALVGGCDGTLVEVVTVPGTRVDGSPVDAPEDPVAVAVAVAQELVSSAIDMMVSMSQGIVPAGGMRQGIMQAAMFWTASGLHMQTLSLKSHLVPGTHWSRHCHWFDGGVSALAFWAWR
ncbi:hypothetical protein O9K51_03586 [Purpureocillium lavendulum]|uniref:Uncharacterized protein n=1 Tax=Purpureocillium lavendulum TaxID=1247861 RepID=A0AB34G3L5_9HYPO|nr:hypothetical protein O9K51_03586 [Purpureocillium lavendulum]